MDLKKEILKEHSKSQTTRIVNYVGGDPLRFASLIKVFLEGPYRVTQRAAWPLGYCVEHNPGLIKPHLKTVLEYLKKPGIHDAAKRNTIRLLKFAEIPLKLHGQIAELCFQYLQDPKEPVAVRVYAMDVLGDIAMHIPDFKNELRIIIEDHLPYASPAFSSRARKVLKRIQ